jgi:hypothetical protein
VRRLSSLLATILSLGLGGCFVSTDALISPSKADHPWSGALRGQHFDWEDGKWKLRGAARLSRQGAYYMLKDEGSDETMRFLLHRIDPGHYIAQAEDLSDKSHPSYIFGLIVVEGDHVYEYGFDDQSSQCSVPDIDPTALKLRPSDDACGVPSLDAMAAVFRALLKAHPEPETLYIIKS